MGRWSGVSGAALAEAVGLDPADSEFVRFFDEVREAWPEVSVEPEEFLNAVRDLQLRRLDPTRAADLLLAVACLRGDAVALEVFERVVMTRVVPALRRVDGRPEVVEEACQLARTKLLVAEHGRAARLREYRGEAPLWVWVKSIAVRLMVDLARANRGHQSVEPAELEARLVTSGALELGQLRNAHRPVVARALARGLTQLTPREQNLLKLAFVDGLSVDRVGLVYGCSRATAARWVAAARDRLKALVHQSVASELELSGAELESFFTALEFSLDRSLRSLFETPTSLP